MAALFIGLWIAGGIPAGILGEVVQAAGMLVGLGVVFVGTTMFLWYRDRAILRGVRRDLGPPEKP